MRSSRRSVALSILTLGLVLGLVSCSPADPGDEETNVDPPAGLCGESDGTFNVVAHADNIYSFSSELELPVLKVKANTPLTFDWSAITTDFLGQPLDPAADVAMASLIVWRSTPEDLATKMNADDVPQSDVAGVIMVYTENQKTSATLDEFTLLRTELDLEEDIMPYLDPEKFNPATHTYTLMVSSGTDPGQGTKMIQAFQLDDESENTAIILNDESTHLEWVADLTSHEPTLVPGESDDILLSWAEIETNASGGVFDATKITEVLVGRYSFSLEELETQFLNIEYIADELYRASVPAGTSLAFSRLQDDEGQAFSGITSEGTWLVALRCTTCTNPAPWYLSVMSECPE